MERKFNYPWLCCCILIMPQSGSGKEQYDDGFKQIPELLGECINSAEGVCMLVKESEGLHAFV